MSTTNDNNNSLIPLDKDQFFIFENAMEATIPNTRRKFKFRAILGFIRYNQKGFSIQLDPNILLNHLLIMKCGIKLKIKVLIWHSY